MSDTSKAVNGFFRTAVRKDVEGLEDELLLTRRQRIIYRMFYIDRHDINLIADTVFISPRAVQKELRLIRRKIVNHMNLDP